MNEKEIQAAIYHGMNLRQRVLTLPNVGLWTWECDLLSVTKTMYCDEYEIKTSRGDFKADFYKHKWKMMGNTDWSRGANRFWYVCPPGLIKADDVQIFAGLIYVDETNCAKVIKKAKLRHRVKLTAKQVLTLAHKLDYRYWHQR